MFGGGVGEGQHITDGHTDGEPRSSLDLLGRILIVKEQYLVDGMDGTGWDGLRDRDTTGPGLGRDRKERSWTGHYSLSRCLYSALAWSRGVLLFCYLISCYLVFCCAGLSLLELWRGLAQEGC